MNLRDEVDVKGLLRGGSGLLELALFLLDPPAMVGIENEDSSSLRPPSYCATPPGIMKHPEYYNEKADFVVQVQDTIFKIRDAPFWDHSQFFILVSQENGTTLERIASEKAKQPTIDKNRVWKLKDVEVDDFTRLLWFIQPLVLGQCKAKTSEDWESILKLADRWMFKDAFNRAVTELSLLSIDPLKKIQLMHKHRIRKEWAIDALVALAMADSFPELKDTKVLGLELTTHLAKARERVSYMNPFWNRRRYEPVKAVVCEVFKLDTGMQQPESWKVPN